MKIKAAVLYKSDLPRPYAKSNPLHIDDVFIDAPQHGEVLIKIQAAGLCHSDLSVIEGNRVRPLPMVLGHEAAGVVEVCGPGVNDLKPGDAVVISFMPSCGLCIPCLTGRPALCEPGATANKQGKLLNGVTRLHDGKSGTFFHHLGVSAFAEYAVVSRHSLVKVSNEIPREIAALFGCAVLTGMGALFNTAAFRPGQSVLITGLGGVGLSALIGAVAAGGSTIIAADVQPAKRAKATMLGAHYVVDPLDPHAREQVIDATNGGADIVLEFAGVIAALEFAFNCVRRGGKVITAGLPSEDKKIQIPVERLVGNELTLMGSYLGSAVPVRDIHNYSRLYLQNKLPLDQLLTHKISLEEINAGFDLLSQGEAIRQVILF